MTSSFTSMLLTASWSLIQVRKKSRKTSGRIDLSVRAGLGERSRGQGSCRFRLERVIYLGAGPFFGLAHEAQLKILELTAGKIATMYESPVGFRHGPKSLINEDTVVLVFGTTTDYTRKYDLDLVREVAGTESLVALFSCSDQAFGLENV